MLVRAFSYAGGAFYHRFGVAAAVDLIEKLRVAGVSSGPLGGAPHERICEQKRIDWMPAQVIADKLAPFVAAGLTAALM
jgi:hypothetical protein